MVIACIQCGKSHTPHRAAKNPKYCSFACYGAARKSTRRCKTCQRTWEPTCRRAGRQYCSRACRAAGMLLARASCVVCGQLCKGLKNRHCSLACMGKARRGVWFMGRAYKAGEVRLLREGYVQEKRANGKWGLQHRLVMERSLGRKLTAREFVHHRDGNRANNQIENLELWARPHPHGQRVADLLPGFLGSARQYSDGYDFQHD